MPSESNASVGQTSADAEPRRPMKLVPRSRWRRALLLVALVLVVFAPRWYPAALFGAKVVVPGPAARNADRRTSPPATRTVELARPRALDTPPSGPGVARVRTRLVAAMTSPIAVADPRGAGPIIVATQAGQIVAV